MCCLGTTLSVFSTAQAQAVSDDQLLSEPLPDDFRYQRVEIYPPVDQRLIGAKLSGTLGSESSSIWHHFLQEMYAYRNLNVINPEATREALQQRLSTNRELRLALEISRRGMKAYREVRLTDAEPLLKDALDRLLSLDYHVVAPTDVALIALRLGQTLLERERNVAAQTYFQQAL